MASLTLPLDDRIKRYIVTAHNAMIPEDQLRNFIKAGYIALDAMLPFHYAARLADKTLGPDSIALGGTRGPGKSHAALAQVGLDDCQRAPGLKALFLRKVMKSAAESLEDLTVKVFRYIDHEFKPSAGRVIFPNGSRILIGGFNDESDIDKYLGIEYDLICVEEATQITEKKKQMLLGSLRSTRSDWRQRLYLTTNPDGVGITWFKREYIYPWRDGKEKYTKFIPGSYKNNPFLGDGYIRYLDGLTGALRAAWRDADWDAFEGMSFPNWNYQLHVIEPFELEESWLKWRAVDWGYANPWCCLWLCKHPDTGRIYVYREAYQVQLDDVQQATRIKDLTTPSEQIAFTFADPAAWGRKVVGQNVSTAADTYRSNGVMLTKADNHRINGKRKVSQALGIMMDGMPGLQIFSNCTNLIRTLPELSGDPNNAEDVNTDLEDHAYDALRYGLTNVQLREAKPAGKQSHQYRSYLATSKYF